MLLSFELTLAILAAFGLVMLILVVKVPSLSIPILFAVPSFRTAILNALPMLYRFTYAIEITLMGVVYWAGIIQVMRTREERLNLPKWPLVLLAIAGVMAWVSLPQSRAPDAWKRAVGISMVNMLFFFSPRLLIRQWKQLRVASLSVVLAGAGLMAILPFLGSFTQWGGRLYIAAAEVAGETRGTGSALAIATAMGAMTIMLLSKLFPGLGSFWAKMLRIGLAVGAVFVLFLTGSRGQLVLLGLMFMVLVYVWRRRPASWVVAALLVLGVGASLSLGLFSSGDVSQRLSAGQIQEAIYTRLAFQSVSFQNYLSSPVIGNGPGDVAYQLQSRGFPAFYSHNVFLDALNELGTIGGTMLIILIIGSLVSAVKAARVRTPDIQAKAIRTGFACLVLFHILLMFKSGSYYGLGESYMIMGVGYLLPHVASDQERAMEEAWYYETEELPADSAPVLPGYGYGAY